MFRSSIISSNETMERVSKTGLCIISYNCNSTRYKIEVFRSFLGICDILICQEVVLLPYEGHLLSGITELFGCLFVPSFLSVSKSGDGRSSGGMVILHRISLGISVRSIAEGPFFCLL